MMNHICAILWKQLKDTLKNKTILIQFVMFPCMTIIMENAIHIQNMPEHFFSNLFAIMYVGMAPLTSAAAIISEEKEKNTLRVLQMCNVRALDFLIGNAVYVITACSLGSLVIGAAGGYRGKSLLYFMLIMVFGHFASFLAGAAIGVFSRNQMMATSVSVPVMMILSFLPMLSMFNEKIEGIAKFIFSEQLFLLVNSPEEIRMETETMVILLCNVVLILVVFIRAYRRAFVKK